MVKHVFNFLGTKKLFAQKLIPVRPVGSLDSFSVGFQIGESSFNFSAEVVIFWEDVEEHCQEPKDSAVKRARRRTHHVRLVSQPV